MEKGKRHQKEKKKACDNTLESKHKGAHKAYAKRKEAIYLEQTQTPKDGDYKVKKQKKKERRKE